MGRVHAYVGLGSNLSSELGAPPALLRSALMSLARLPDSALLGVSPFYRSAALTLSRHESQPPYCNAVAILQTSLAAPDLLEALLDIERVHGRQRRADARWQPRQLDLDLLLYGRGRVSMAGLQVPHPALAERVFVLQPLADLAAELSVPGLGVVGALLRGQGEPALEIWR